MAILEKKSIERGMEKGELIGGIRMAKRILKEPVSQKEQSSQNPLEVLRQILYDLESRLK